MASLLFGVDLVRVVASLRFGVDLVRVELVEILT